MNYVSLHNHTDYSALDGLCQIPKLIQKAKICGHTSLAITDHGSLSGCFKFDKLCTQAGIKPILGMEAYFCWDISDKVQPYHLTILAQNKKGWKNLIKLNYFSNTLGFYYKPRISWDQLKENNEGLIILSGCLNSPFSKKLLSDIPVEDLIKQFKSVFNERFFIEIMNHGLPNEEKVNFSLAQIAALFNIKTVATNDVHYINKKDYLAQDIIMSTGTKSKLSDPERLKLPNKEFYYKSTDEMKLMHTTGDIKTSELIAESIEDKVIEKQKSVLPVYPAGEIEKRINSKITKESYKLSPEERSRLKLEMEIINSAGLQNYLLMVSDYVGYATHEKIFVGPGRGSVAGSLVAYFLEIHKIHPIKYGLLFSRFYNSGRASKGSLPDIDVDFPVESISHVRHHMEDQYGRNNVAMVGTFNRMSIKSAIKSVSRAMDIPFKESNNLTKNITNDEETLEDCLKLSEFNNIYKLKKWKNIIDIAFEIKDNLYSESIHAAGIVVSSKKLINIIPCRVDRLTNSLITCWDMEDLEDIGLLKFDFLSLSTLDVLEKTLSDAQLNIKNITLEDEKTYQTISHGDTVGLFQLGSDGITEICKQIQPRSIEDLAVIVSLYRPGPIQANLHNEYIARRSGRKKIHYNHPLLEKSLKETYGVLCYQEQVIKSLIDLAKFTEEEADHVRKIMGKKLGDKEMEKVGIDFIARAEDNNIQKKDAIKIWEEIKGFAGYAFNKCISGETIVYRGNSNKNIGKNKSTISHMFNIKNDKEYANRKNQIHLHKKFKYHGYGEILALDNDGRIRPRKIKNIMFSGIKETYSIMFSNGISIRATKNHKFLTINGFIKVKDIEINKTQFIVKKDDRYEKIESYKTKTIMAISIEYYGKEETYDIEMDTLEHNFIANGLVSSNSHAVSYAHLTYYTAYLKTHYPVQFMCALLNMSIGKKDKMSHYLNEVKRMGIDLKPVDIKFSKDLFTNDGNSIYFGLAAIKGVGFGAEDKINRNNMLDFLTKSNLNSTAITNIILCGGYGKSILEYYKILKPIINNNKFDERYSLFSPYELIKQPKVEDFTIKEIIENEYNLMGVVLSIDIFSLKWFKDNPITNNSWNLLLKADSFTSIKIGGMITDILFTQTKKLHEKMAIITLLCPYKTVKVVCFPEQFNQFGNRIFEGNLISVVGKTKEGSVLVEYINDIL